VARAIIVLSQIIIDDIVLPDGQRILALGGAGSYAATGILCCWPTISIVAGIGRDLARNAVALPSWLRLDDPGLQVRDEYTVRARLVYSEDGERQETPVLGLAHFAKMQSSPADIPACCLPAAGIYCFRDASNDFWNAIRQRREQLGIVLWELAGSAAKAQQWPAVRARLPDVDVFSINLREAQTMLNQHDPQQIVTQLLIGGAERVLLRLGADGALVGDRRVRLRVSPPPGPVVDVTGGGNCFSGTFLGACCAGWTIEEATRAASAAAARCVADFGPPAIIDPAQLHALSRAAPLRHVGVVA
jgi:sugar/nucleoside kinase (ribokinase family)